jgi:tetratricopeptide (TPR) repeat protein
MRKRRVRLVVGGLAVMVLSVWSVAVYAQEPASGQEAASEAAAGSEAEPAPSADLSEANELVRAGDYAQADEALEQILTEFPDDPSALLMRGEVLLVLGRFPDAQSLLAKCAELDPERERVHFQLATALQNTGDIDEALEHYAKEIELNDDEEVKIMSRLNRSFLLGKQGQWSKAAAELEAVLEIDPDRPEIYGDLATLYLQSGKLDETFDALRRGLEAGFSSSQHFYVLGSRYYRDDLYEKAADAFAQALATNPGNADAERSLGATLEQLGREKEAAQHFQRYLELRPDAPEANELKKRIAAITGA